MIVQLQPDQIVAFWDTIRHSTLVANKVAKEHEQNFINGVLENLLSGKAQAWVGYTINDEGHKIFYALGLTVHQEDVLSGLRMLCLHTLYAFRPIPKELLEDMLPKLKEYAKTSNCFKMFTFTSVPRLREYYTQNGFTQDTSLYVLDL